MALLVNNGIEYTPICFNNGWVCDIILNILSLWGLVRPRKNITPIYGLGGILGLLAVEGISPGSSA